jgi:Trypsin-co-occurring domain 2
VIELAEVVNQLRYELQAAMTARPDDGVRFELGPVEVEAVVAVEKQRTGSGHIRFYVVELGGDTHLTASQTQRIKLVLNPVDARDGRPPWVSGESVRGER